MEIKKLTGNPTAILRNEIFIQTRKLKNNKANLNEIKKTQNKRKKYVTKTN